MAWFWCGMSQESLRILHIISGLQTGGAESALYNLLRGGLARKFNCHVLSLKDEGTMGKRLRAAGIPVSVLDMGYGVRGLVSLRKLNQTVKDFRPDIIQGWMYHGNLAASLVSRRDLRQSALVWNIRHSLYDIGQEKAMMRLVIRANRYLSKKPDRLLYNSELSRQQHEHFGFSSVKSTVIPNGIDMVKFRFVERARQRTRSDLGISQDAFVVGNVARLHPMKDHTSFLNATVSLAQRYPLLHVLLCGRGVTWENKLIASLIPRSLKERFYLLGDRGDVPELMSAMDLYCQSSWSEAFPNVLGEAMACGLPCVATNVGDSAIIVGDSGKIVPPNNENDLAKGIEELMHLSVGERCGLGTRARIEVNYTLGKIVNQYAEMYENLGLQKGKN